MHSFLGPSACVVVVRSGPVARKDAFHLGKVLSDGAGSDNGCPRRTRNPEERRGWPVQAHDGERQREVVSGFRVRSLRPRLGMTENVNPPTYQHNGFAECSAQAEARLVEEDCYSAAMRIAGPPISARHLVRLSPSGSTSAAVRALAIASTARAGAISPASAGRITRSSMAR